MKLGLKHLAPYLPYKLKIKTKHGFDTMGTLNEWLVNGDHEKSYSYENHPNEILEFKPILRPLSELDVDSEVNTPESLQGCCYSYVQHLLENHFDIFGLIPAGLAIDSNTLTDNK
jgi:hypothetical protein